MKNTTQRFKSKDKGIAIMFTLIMLSIFFLISFGFVSMATSHKTAASAREPAQQADLAAHETVLNEAMFAIEEGLINGETPNLDKFRDMKFINAADTMSVTLNAWATRESDQTNLDSALPLQVDSGDDFTPDTNTTDNPTWADVGWITHDVDGDSIDDKYCWMVIDSSGVDPNYIGDSSIGNLTGDREGTYVREIDVGTIDASFRTTGANSIYVDWRNSPPTVWEDKKSLISGLTSQIETAIQLFEPGTTPITLKAVTSSDKFDLSNNPTSATAVFNAIPWLSSAAAGDITQAQQIACNITDYIDTDNIASNIGTVYGKERVPYLNEVKIKFDNDTAPGSTGTPEPVEIELEVSVEVAKIFAGVSSWGTPNGSSASVEFIFDITATKSVDGQGFSLTNQSVTISDDLSGTATGYFQLPTGATSFSGGSSDQASTLVELTFQPKEMILYGAAGEIWDYVNFGGITSADTSVITNSDDLFISYEVQDCRNSNLGWDSSKLFHNRRNYWFNG